MANLESKLLVFLQFIVLIFGVVAFNSVAFFSLYFTEEPRTGPGFFSKVISILLLVHHKGPLTVLLCGFLSNQNLHGRARKRPTEQAAHVA